MGSFFEDNRQAAISVLALWGILIALFLGGSNIYHRITDVRAKLKQSQSQLNQLEGKLETLNDAQSNSISESAIEATEALPVNNPAMALILQINRLVNDNNLATISITLAGGGNDSLSGITQTSLDMTIQGELTDINNFLLGLERVKPLSNLRAVAFRHPFGDEAVRAELTVSTFWSDLPSELPSVSQTVSNLTQSEQATIETVAQFTDLASAGLEGSEVAPTLGNPFSFR